MASTLCGRYLTVRRGDASIRCMATRRTTLSAEADDLARLEQEAQRRGVSLAALLRDIVAQAAEMLRTEQRPRFGIGRSGGLEPAASIADHDDEPYEAQAFRS